MRLRQQSQLLEVLSKLVVKIILKLLFRVNEKAVCRIQLSLIKAGQWGEMKNRVRISNYC